MKSLVEHMVEQGNLEERLLRTGAIATYGVRSRKEGDASVRAFRQGQQELRKTMSDNTVEGRLERIEKSLDALFVGLIKQRQQIGAGVSVDVAGHMLAAKARKKR